MQLRLAGGTMPMNPEPARARAHTLTNLHTAATSSRQLQLAAQSHTDPGAMCAHSLVACQEVCYWPHNLAPTPGGQFSQMGPLLGQGGHTPQHPGSDTPQVSVSGPHTAVPRPVPLLLMPMARQVPVGLAELPCD